MWDMSPLPEITMVMAPTLSVAGPSWVNCPPLFEEPAIWYYEGIKKEAPTTSGEYSLTPLLRSELTLDLQCLGLPSS